MTTYFDTTSGSGAVSNGSGGLTVSETGHVTTITIGVSGDYDIAADGAEGGEAGSLFLGYTQGTSGGASGAPIYSAIVPGGLGASVGGDVYLAAGATLEIVVGQEGGAAASPGDAGGGGGGGSFIIETNTGGASPQTVDTILAVAGGGGGSGLLVGGGAGQAATHAASGSGTNGGAGGAGDHGGLGGLGSGGGGGGFTGGLGGAPSGGGGGSVSGHSFSGGGDGGFGGGGGGGGGLGFTGSGGGGGGGGYGGGGGGGEGALAAGGGGGSYLNSTLTNTTATGGVHSGDGQITLTLLCFAPGALIRTARGEAAVEDLAVGDLAVTASGDVRPIRWIGYRTVPNPVRAYWPVRVMAGAFGEGLPCRDLLLSPGHAVCVRVMDEVFVPVGQLINGATIAQVEVAEVTYWHVELESHDVLLAEGLPCESYMDAGNRAWFGHDYGRLAEIDPQRVAESLARYARPFVDGGPVVEAIRLRLAARAEALGWIRNGETNLHLVVDGQRIEPRIDGGLACFVFPAKAREARLASRRFAGGGDRRELGVRIDALYIGDGLRLRRKVPLDCIAGFHPEEAASGAAWRWTDGDLALPAELWAGCEHLSILTLSFKAGHAWLAPKNDPLRAVA